MQLHALWMNHEQIPAATKKIEQNLNLYSFDKMSHSAQVQAKDCGCQGICQETVPQLQLDRSWDIRDFRHALNVFYMIFMVGNLDGFSRLTTSSDKTDAFRWRAQLRCAELIAIESRQKFLGLNGNPQLPQLIQTWSYQMSIVVPKYSSASILCLLLRLVLAACKKKLQPEKADKGEKPPTENNGAGSEGAEPKSKAKAKPKARGKAAPKAAA